MSNENIGFNTFGIKLEVVGVLHVNDEESVKNLNAVCKFMRSLKIKG